ncbi:MAG: COG4223 family protein [Solirubrobacterales bacterium]
MTHTDAPTPQPQPLPEHEPVPPSAAQTEEPQAAPQPAPDTSVTEDEGKGLPWGLLVGVILVVGLAVTAVVTFPQWRDEMMPAKVAVAPTALVDADLASLRAELAQTRDRLRQIEDRVAAMTEAGAPVAGQAGEDPRVAQLDKAVRALQAQPQVPARMVEQVDALALQVADLKRTAADAAAVLRLADRVEKTEAEMRDIKSRRTSAGALLLAVGQLREAVNAAMPFDAEWRAVRALAPQDAEVTAALDTIRARAAAGIPTRLVLAERFESLAPELVRAETLPETRSWWRDTLHRVSTLVTVRREDGNAAGQGPAAITARAQARLATGDLAGAVSQVEQLGGAPAEAAAAWLADAQARLAADAATGALTAHVVAALGAGQ